MRTDSKAPAGHSTRLSEEQKLLLRLAVGLPATIGDPDYSSTAKERIVDWRNGATD